MTNSEGNDSIIPRSASVATTEYAVLVVGAGPTGLLLAAELERRHVPCHLIEARSAPLHWDRATVIHPRSLEIFESLGLVNKFLAAGCKQRMIQIYSEGVALGTLDLTNCGSVYGFNLGLSEEVTETILTEHLQQVGGRLNRSSRLVGLLQHEHGVWADIEDQGGSYRVNARWVVGCDGLHSPTREWSNIGFEGHDISKPWAVFDAAVSGWSGSYEATFVYLDMLPMILTALPRNRWRIYLRPSSDFSDLVADATAVLERYAPGTSFVEVENATRFRCHTKVATAFRSGSVLLAGDAAHVCSPSEGHGMNCGLQDAFNLAWKLALVQHGFAGVALLDSYQAERRPVAEMITKSGDDTEAAQTVTDPKARLKRDQTIKAMLENPIDRHHETVAETELNVQYLDSPIVFGDFDDTGLGPGCRLPCAISIEAPDRGGCRLHELTRRTGHTVVLIGGPSASPDVLLHLDAALRRAIVGSAIFEEVVSLATQPGLSSLVGHIEPSVAATLGITTLTLFAVRPDGYVGLRADHDHLESLERYRFLILAREPAGDLKHRHDH